MCTFKLSVSMYESAYVQVCMCACVQACGCASVCVQMYISFHNFKHE